MCQRAPSDMPLGPASRSTADIATRGFHGTFSSVPVVAGRASAGAAGSSSIFWREPFDALPACAMKRNAIALGSVRRARALRGLVARREGHDRR